ncbi:hypothetical protein A2U01_0002159 [Trifolium medium]|uniref:Uncharacterized protein n=1 Tax=Trifolium medium TaxID=97028 RepID=A0A392M2W6_9FABA|nr:hypothetical protein [Trifolium medium]
MVETESIKSLSTGSEIRSTWRTNQHPPGEEVDTLGEKHDGTNENRRRFDHGGSSRHEKITDGSVRKKVEQDGGD